MHRDQDIESTKVSLAFFLPSGDTEHDPIPEKQPVYAFLPAKSYGLKFVVQVRGAFLAHQLFLSALMLCLEILKGSYALSKQICDTITRPFPVFCSVCEMT